MTSLDAGGTERQMIELMRRLDPARWTIHLACLHARGRWLARASEAAVSVTEFPISGFGRVGTCRQAIAFSRWCAVHRIAVVHTADLYTNIFALPAAAFARVPLRVANRRGFNADRSAALLALQRAAYSCAHVVAANSDAAAGRLRQEQVPEHKVAVVRNGLDIGLFQQPRTRSRYRRVIAVANLRPVKGLDVLVDATSEVLRRFPDAVVHVAGSGPEQAAITARAAAAGIADKFVCLGARDEVPALLAESDIFVLPSRSESLPNSVLEAMAAGLPIVASAVGGIPELIDDGRTGVLVPSGDPQALAAALCRVMADANFAGQLGTAARAQAEARYSFDRMAADFESLYLRGLARRAGLQTERAA
jgi:glycosyltransferase involved in cell wall biosynthesis